MVDLVLNVEQREVDELLVEPITVVGEEILAFHYQELNGSSGQYLLDGKFPLRER